MKISITIQILWPLAVKEATAGKACEIEPGHLVCAALKAVEIEPETLKKAIPDPRLLQAFDEERKILAESFQKRGITQPEESTRIRRRLRGLLRSMHGGGRMPADGVMHRSAAAKGAFLRAEEKARDGTGHLRAVELIDAVFEEPGDALASAFEQLGISSFEKGEEVLEWIRKLGRNMTDEVRKVDTGRIETIRKDPVCKVLREFLCDQDRGRPILLVGSEKRTPFDVVSDLAGWMASHGSSSEERRRILIEIDSVTILDRSSGVNPETRLEELLRNVVKQPTITLFFADFHRYLKDELAGRGFAERVLRLLRDSGVSCIAGLDRSAYEEHIGADRERKRHFQIVEVHDLSKKFML